jgi:DNA transformation protein
MEHGDRAFLEEMLAPLGGVAIRRMFGGLGVFRDGLMFGLVVRGALYLKAAPEETASFAAEGGAPFSYATKGGRTTVIASYWRAPDRLVDEPEEFVIWARRACAAAEGAGRAKPAGRRRAEA